MTGTEFALVSLLAIVILPFGIGWWIGHPVFAAGVFIAMSLTVAVGAVGRGDAAGSDPATGLALSLAVSSASAAAGGFLRARHRARDAGRR